MIWGLFLSLLITTTASTCPRKQLNSSVSCLPSLPLSCTTSAASPLPPDFCLPKTTKDFTTLIVTNIVVIIVVGSTGNLLTLLALPYCWRYHNRPSLSSFTIIFILHLRYYSRRFPSLSSSTTVLILHLAFCDFLYCTLGLTVQADIILHARLRYKAT